MEIRHKETGAILFKDESPTIKETLENAGKAFRTIVGKSVHGGQDENRQTIWEIDQDLLRTAPDLRGANLKGADLSEMDLRGIEVGFVNPDTDSRATRSFYFSLEGADLSQANLNGATLNWVDLSNATLEGANVEYLPMTQTNMFDCVETLNIRFDGITPSEIGQSLATRMSEAEDLLWEAELERYPGM